MDKQGCFELGSSMFDACGSEWQEACLQESALRERGLHSCGAKMYRIGCSFAGAGAASLLRQLVPSLPQAVQ